MKKFCVEFSSQERTTWLSVEEEEGTLRYKFLHSQKRLM
jgi:hypothetical protein